MKLFLTRVWSVLLAPFLSPPGRQEGLGRPLLGLVVWRAEQLPKGWRDLVASQGWDFVSVKIVQGAKRFEAPAARALVAELQRLDQTVHGWGFHFCSSVEAAQAEGRAAARECLELGLPAYHWNAEAQWAASLTPAENAIAFAIAFKGVAPRVELWANSFSDEMTPEAVEHFDVWEPMAYGSLPKSIAKNWRRLDQFGESPPVKCAVMVGTGRVDEKGEVMGWFADTPRGPGLVTLAKQHRPYAISFFRAPFLLETGNQYNPPLGAQVAALRAAFEQEAS